MTSTGLYMVFLVYYKKNLMYQSELANILGSDLTIQMQHKAHFTLLKYVKSELNNGDCL